MVQVAVPGERWEIELFSDKGPEIEIFQSDGTLGGADLIDRLLSVDGD